MNSHPPVGRLAAYLEALSREQVWFAIVAATSLVAWLDFRLPSAGFATAYIPVICGASWGLGVREGYLVAATSALLSVSSSLIPPTELSALALAVVIRVAAFLFLAATINSFRRSYDRELFHAHHDPMTRTLNKEVFHSRARKVIRDAAHTRQILLLIVLDLDDFRSVNSMGGHRAGDEVIRNFAEGISALMRREDLVGRVGGDEFSLLVRVPTIAEGSHFAYSLHDRLSAVLGRGRYSVTCTMGALLIPSNAPRNFSELMHAADQALYRAKAAGKNAVEIVTVGDQPTDARATQRATSALMGDL